MEEEKTRNMSGNAWSQKFFSGLSANLLQRKINNFLCEENCVLKSCKASLILWREINMQFCHIDQLVQVVKTSGTSDNTWQKTTTTAAAAQ